MKANNFIVEIKNKIASVKINRPDKANSLQEEAWEEMEIIFKEMDRDPSVRVVILSGEGKHFCSGIDLMLLGGLQARLKKMEPGRRAEQVRDFAKKLQAPINAIENCRKPVIAAIHKACVGGGLDIAAACDLRYCTSDAFFSVREIMVGMVADLGSLQRLQAMVPQGFLREIAYTGRDVAAEEALRQGLANGVFPDLESLHQQVQQLAEVIASRSPLSIRGSKQVLNYSRDHSVQEGLEYIATWNGGMLLSADLEEAIMATMAKRKPDFMD